MQTFLPYPSFARSARALDDRRLGKQRVEDLQILRALVWPVYAWKNHPAVAMWRGFTPALVAYGLAVCDEWVARGRADATRASILEFSGGAEPTYAQLRERGELPPWLGLDAVHASHQSALVRKDPAYYRPLFPDVPDDLPYAWPTPAFPRWPVRRGVDAPLSLGDAQALLGLADVPEELLRVLVAVQEGASVAVDLPAGPTAAAAGLLAGLCTPGWTAWVHAGAPLPAEETPPQRPPVEAGGRLAERTARPPTAADLAAMRTEAGAVPEFRFLPAAQATPRRLAGAGLVVVEDDVAGPTGLQPPPGVPVLRLPAGTPPRLGSPVGGTAARA